MFDELVDIKEMNVEEWLQNEMLLLAVIEKERGQ